MAQTIGVVLETGIVIFTENDGSGLYAFTFGLAGFVLGLLLSVFLSCIWSSLRPVMPVITRIVNRPFLT